MDLPPHKEMISCHTGEALASRPRVSHGRAEVRRGNSETHRLHKGEQSFLIPLPLRVELLLCWEFVTAQLHSDLQAVRVEVVEV